MRSNAAIVLSLAAAAASTALASDFRGNLNYHSPSRRDAHVNLGIDVPHVTRRSAEILKRAADADGSYPTKGPALNFTHGVASGDPYPDSVILWTRAAPSEESDRSNVTVEGTVPLYNHDTETYVRADPHPICLEWSVFEHHGDKVVKEGNRKVVSRGQAFTTSDIDYTVKASSKFLTSRWESAGPRS